MLTSMEDINSGIGASSPTRSAPAEKWAWLGLAILMLTTLLALLDNGIVFLALPRVMASLHATNTESLWIADIYAYFSVSCLVTMGRLGDAIGHRKLLMIGAAGFTVFSLLAAFSVSPFMLIAMRALLGICGATMGPSLFALARTMYPDPKKFATAISLMGTSALIGVSAGPAIGGLLLNTFWWGSVFLIALPVMALVLIAGPFVLLETPNRVARKLDLVSVALSITSIVAVIYGLTTMANTGWQLSPTIVIAAGLMVGVVFVRRQRRLAEPLLDMRLLGVRAIWATLVMFTLTGVVQGGNSFALIQHLQLVEGYSPLVASLWMIIPLAAAIAGIHASTILAKRFRPGYVLMGGLLTSAAGELILSQTGAPGLVTLIVGLSIAFIGTSPVGSLSNQLIMHAAPADKQGSAVALGSTGGDFGSATGVAVFGSLITIFYSGHVRTPAGVGPAARATANTSIIDAEAVAQHLPTATADQLVSAARAAFSTATDNIAMFAVALFIVLAILVFATLRPILPIGHQQEDEAAQQQQQQQQQQQR